MTQWFVPGDTIEHYPHCRLVQRNLHAPIAQQFQAHRHVGLNHRSDEHHPKHGYDPRHDRSFCHRSPSPSQSPQSCNEIVSQNLFNPAALVHGFSVLMQDLLADRENASIRSRIALTGSLLIDRRSSGG
jgi:hypothetical protein